MLRAKGIPYRQEQGPGGHRLLVDEVHAGAALRELRDYEEENRDWPPREEPWRAAPGAIEGLLGFAVVATGVYVCQATDLLGADWLREGANASDRIWKEPWRAVTALTLHTDPAHLVSNLVFGALFGYLVGSTHGGGLGWLAILLSGALGNLLNAGLRGPGALSVGASTAVFGAVGLLVGSEWRRRLLLRQRRLRRAAPVLMGFLLLSYLGVGGERTDVTAHLTGLVAGLPLGALLTGLSEAAQRRRLQLACAAYTLLLLAFSWTLALVA